MHHAHPVRAVCAVFAARGEFHGDDRIWQFEVSDVTCARLLCILIIICILYLRWLHKIVEGNTVVPNHQISYTKFLFFYKYSEIRLVLCVMFHFFSWKYAVIIWKWRICRLTSFNIWLVQENSVTCTNFGRIRRRICCHYMKWKVLKMF